MRTTRSSRRGERLSTEDLRRAFRESPIAMLFATGFGAGLAPVAPGTAGSAAALLVAGAIAASTSSMHGGSLSQAVGLLMSGLAIAAAAVPLSTRAARALRAKDPGCIVLDEVAGQLLAVSPAPLFLYRSGTAVAAAWIV